MPRQRQLTPSFVEFIPEQVEEGMIYVSMEYATATHKCACGCGFLVVTPFSPTDWRITFDGRSVTLHPSIGNWSFPCRSHYFVRNSLVQWAGQMSNAEIEVGRKRDRAAKSAYFMPPREAVNDASPSASLIKVPTKAYTPTHSDKKVGLWEKLKRLLIQ
jgi:hypothetical protein